MDWKRYAVALLLFNLVFAVSLFAMLLLQGMLPLNPQKLPAFSWHLALHTALSFTTNTNWQNYAGESAASYFTQMFGFAEHNFISAATGIAIAIAAIRGIIRRRTTTTGNFWVDTIRQRGASSRGGARTLGSSLIGQPFSSRHYFWPRPSASTDFGYNPEGSGGSNAGPNNLGYLKTVADRVKALQDAGGSGTVPFDLVQASASGLDTEISPEGAFVQISRVAKARGLKEDAEQRVVVAHTEDR
jgi:K+-transporting ATPase KdpC subunit